MREMGLMKRIAKILMLIAILAISMPFASSVTHAAEEPQVFAETHILIEAESGRILSGSDVHRRMFPAATTMILTAILAYEHIGMDEIVLAGSEVSMLPLDSARNFHEIHEAILGENLLRGMLIGAGNDTANIIAMEVARRLTENPDITFGQAQVFFANLMTEKAIELGALDSHFMNPHGYHHDSHFTTAYDMAQIARHAMSIDIIAQIAAEGRFSGPMAGPNPHENPLVPDGAEIVTRTWNSVNQLIRPGDNYYPYAVGIRTGFTRLAGETLVAAAKQDDITLISVTFNSPEIEGYPTRWQDNINLFEFGFNNFAYRIFLDTSYAVGQMYIYEPRLDDDGYLEFFASQQGRIFLSNAELGRMEREIVFLSQFVTYNEDEEMMFTAPIEENQIIGNLTYTLDGEIIFTTSVYSSRYVYERDAAADIDFWLTRVNEIFFSSQAVPFWIAGISVSLLLMVLILLARNAIKRNKKDNKYKWKY